MPRLLSALAAERPIFHSEADFQHALGWQIHTDDPTAQVRLETRPQRGTRLDLLVRRSAGELVAIEHKYLVRSFDGVVAGEHFQLPNQAAHDISRYDFINDISRIERFVANGLVHSGWAIALSNDPAYWRSGWKVDPVDSAFRIHDGCVLAGTLEWGRLAGKGTTAKRETPLILSGRHDCQWRDYSTIRSPTRKAVGFRYLAFEVRGEHSART